VILAINDEQIWARLPASLTPEEFLSQRAKTERSALDAAPSVTKLSLIFAPRKLAKVSNLTLNLVIARKRRVNLTLNLVIDLA
jgi:hypothetical protein